MKRLRIGYFADGPWSHQAMEYLLTDPSIEIAFIVPRRKSFDTVLSGLAQKHQIPFLENSTINNAEFIASIAPYRCDLFVSMSFDQIFKKKILDIPSLGTINCHAGKLPFYRGRNVLNWVLINDEKEFGITVHFIDEGIDTGDIILQKILPITDDDSYESLLTIAYKTCATLLYDAIKLIQHGKTIRTKQAQIDPIGSYCRKRGTGDEIIRWQQSSRQLFNFIRAICYPGIKAQTTLNGEVIKINKARLMKGDFTPFAPAGKLIARTEQGFVVKTMDSALEIFDFETPIGLKIGDQLGS